MHVNLFEKLPEKDISLIFSMLPYRDQINLDVVCKLFHKSLQDKEIFYKLHHHKYSVEERGLPTEENALKNYLSNSNIDLASRIRNLTKPIIDYMPIGTGLLTLGILSKTTYLDNPYILYSIFAGCGCIAIVDVVSDHYIKARQEAWDTLWSIQDQRQGRACRQQPSLIEGVAFLRKYP
ncbi:MAG: hypothetical protein H0W50_09025 [Parachlamydiaceae bacterium]|nr:hypothetical protein [Parachlamydiaceae bacterium]